MAPKKRKDEPKEASEAKRPKAKAKSSPASSTTKNTDNDALQLHGLFEGAEGASWEEPLREVLENLPEASKFIGPARDKSIVPVRELTFQALKPNRPEALRVVVFGQNPYPRLESATGIAMFDNAFETWDSKRFGSVVSMRCIIKAAAMAKYGIPVSTGMEELRALLREKDIVSPPEFFQSMLAQGVLLMNAALTIGGPGLSTANHNKFWQPVVNRVVQEILRTKSEGDGAVVFAWWGAESLKTKKVLAKVLAEFDGKVAIRHLDFCNPAAQGDLFCKPEVPHFTQINQILEEVGLPTVDWLPDRTWLKDATEAGGGASNNASAMGSFISQTKELHKMYMERLQSGLDKVTTLEPIQGIMDTRAVGLQEACKALALESPAAASMKAVESRERGELSSDEAASIHMYTGDSLYRKLNEVLRSPDREAVNVYFSYLRLFLTALKRAPAGNVPLFRGIKKDLAHEYPEGSTVVWWAVSSCTPNLKVAKSFGGGMKGGTLFRVQAKTAVPIKALSAYVEEEEFVLAPGTALKVVRVDRPASGAVEISLEEVPDQKWVS